MKAVKLAACTAAACLIPCLSQAATVSLIDAGIGAGNGDFNYEGGATTNPGTLSVNENIPRDRALISSGTPGQSISVDGWTFERVAYNGANPAFGLDGHFGFDAASFEPNNTGSGQAFTNGNNNTIVDLIADTIAQGGVAGDVFDLSYLLGSDSGGANATVTLTLDAGLPSEQVAAFAQATRTGTARDGSTAVAEQYISTGNYSTVDLTLQMNPNNSSRSLIDDVRLTVDLVIPEPGTVALSMLALTGFGAVGMRNRLG